MDTTTTTTREATMAQHTPSPVEARPASQPGALAHFASTCTCGLVMANTIKTNVDLDVREHLRYFGALDAKASRAMARGAAGRERDRQRAIARIAKRAAR